MKMLLAIVNKDDEKAVATALIQQGFFATKLMTTGGFLRVGNTTFLLGVEEERVNQAIEVIRSVSRRRTQDLPRATKKYFEGETMLGEAPTEITVGGATVFVLDIDRMEKL